MGNSGEQVLAPRHELEHSTALDRVASFRLTYIAIFGFLIFYVLTVQAAELLLDRHFQRAVADAVRIDPTAEGPLVARIQERVDRAVRQSPWVRYGGVRVTAIVLGADGRTLFVGSPTASSRSYDGKGGPWETRRVLPASAGVVTSVPHGAVLTNTILVIYGGLLIQLLFVRSRILARREEERLRSAVQARDATMQRAGEIERELDAVRHQLAGVEPEHGAHADEMRTLERERAQLQQQLESLEAREATLRRSSQQAQRLEEERETLEELLDEALQDLTQKEQAIRTLETRLKKASRSAAAGSRAREAEQLGRRLRTLYKTLEIDERALQDLAGLGDESLKLKAEECLKRLSDEADNAAVRRKVGGLPPHLSIFELGFAGKGRVYYTRGRQRRFRVLLVGAKNSQKTDLEYLSRLPKE